MHLITVVALAACFIPFRCTAGQQFELGGAVAAVRLSRETPVDSTQFTATTIGFEGRVSIESWLDLAVRYSQGGLTSESAEPGQDLVEGELMVWFWPLREMALLVGPHVRSLVSAAGRERWLFLEVRLHGEARLLGPVRGYLDGWRVLAADVNVGVPFDNGYGIDGGLIISASGFPLSFTVRYRAERARLGNGARLETIARLALVVGFERP